MTLIKSIEGVYRVVRRYWKTARWVPSLLEESMEVTESVGVRHLAMRTSRPCRASKRMRVRFGLGGLKVG